MFASLIPTTWVRYLIVALVVTAAIGGYSGWVYEKGVEHESARRDAADLRVSRARAESFGRALEKGSVAVQLYLAEKRNREFYEKQIERKIDRAQESELATCPVPQADGKSPACVFTRYYVGLWNDGWLGRGGAEPVQGDPGGPTPEERQPTALGPRDILKNEQANALSCADDRRRLDALVDLIPKLSEEWDRSHKSTP